MIKMRKKKHYDLHQIGNMDETPMNFDMPHTRTVHTSGKKTVLIKTTGNEKSLHSRIGKLPPMIIFKRKTMPKEEIPSGVSVHVHEKGWMDQGGMKLWIDKVWHRRPGALLRKD